MTKRLLVLASLLLAVSFRGAAAEEPRDAGLEAMKALPQLAGRWEGGGWIRQGPGEPVRFVGEEHVEPRLDGRVLVIEGKHWSLDRSRVVHHAFAVLSHDPGKQGYRFQTHLANGRGGDFSGRLDNGAFIWEMDSPGRPHPLCHPHRGRTLARDRRDRAGREVASIPGDGSQARRELTPEAPIEAPHVYWGQEGFHCPRSPPTPDQRNRIQGSLR